MRCRVTLDLDANNEIILSQTESKLVEYIRTFIIQKYDKLTKKEVVFQSSYDLQTFGNSFDNVNQIFTQFVNNKQFIYTIDGFAQVSYKNAEFAHNTVFKFLQEFQNQHNLQTIGIGGESLIYSTMIECINKTFIYTNSNGVHNNNLQNVQELKHFKNPIECMLVNYNQFELPIQTSATLIIVNVSKNGMRIALCKKINQPTILDIVGIYCSDAYKKDISYLNNYYIYKLATQDNLTITHFKRIPLVSLGNSCVIAYQLQVHHLRTTRFPFDWIRYKSVNQLIDCLHDKFAEFTNFISEKVPTGTFPVITGDNLDLQGNINNKIVKTNKYGMSFPHDILNDNDIEKYKNRIIRLFDVPLVDYIIDCPINEIQKTHLINLLPNMRKLIIINEINSCIITIQIQNGTVTEKQTKLITDLTKKEHTIYAWQKPYIDWSDVFSQ